MIKIKIDKNRRGEPVFKMHVPKKDMDRYRFLKRALLEAKEIKGKYEYDVPMRYFLPIINNMNREDFIIDGRSIGSFLEFSDEYDEQFFYASKATAAYMRIWREVGCPDIFKIIINIEEKKSDKILAFKKISVIG